jgi:hypothetical protein
LGTLMFACDGDRREAAIGESKGSARMMRTEAFNFCKSYFPPTPKRRTYYSAVLERDNGDTYLSWGAQQGMIGEDSVQVGRIARRDLALMRPTKMQ